MQSIKHKAVTPYILLVCQIHHHPGVAYGRRKKPVATASHSRWRHRIRQTSSVWWPALYFIASWILSATGIGSCDSVELFHKHILGVHYVYIYHCSDISFQHRWRYAIVNYDVLPAPSNKRKAVGACHGNLTTLHGIVGAHFVVTIHLKFIVLMQSSIHNLKTHLCPPKHYDITNIS